LYSAGIAIRQIQKGNVNASRVVSIMMICAQQITNSLLQQGAL
jgi:hypothetical protein